MFLAKHDQIYHKLSSDYLFEENRLHKTCNDTLIKIFSNLEILCNMLDGKCWM